MKGIRLKMRPKKKTWRHCKGQSSRVMSRQIQEVQNKSAIASNLLSNKKKRVKK